MGKLLYKSTSAILQCVRNQLLKIMIVCVESLQCGKVNDVNLNQLTVSFCTWGEVKGMYLESFVRSFRDTLYSLDVDSSLTSQKM